MVMDDNIRKEIHYHHYHYHHYHNVESVNQSTSIIDIPPIPYDSIGAAVFIVVVLLWFSLGFVCMLGVQIRAPSETIEECARRRAKLFITTLRDQTHKKQILEELVDKEKRDKLWDIYLGKTESKKEKLKRAELLRIRNIQKQLAVINRNRLIMNDTVVTPTTKYVIRRSVSESRSTFISHLTAFENQSTDRRRSSFDEQVIKRWKTAIQSTETSEKCSSRMRDGCLHRYFRRSEINPLELKPRNTSTNQLLPDDEQKQLTRPLTKKSYERLNPYITYFHLPINKNCKSNIENLPLVTIDSNHHIIQMEASKYQC